MTAIEEAREVLKLDLGMRLSPGDSLYPMSARGVQRLKDALDALIAEHERLIREMHQRELHHFETEKMLTEAGIDPDVPLSDDDRQALAEIVARAIRAGRYSGKMVATPQPPEWHNPVDLRDGRRAVDAILASDVWRNRRQGPTPPPSDDEIRDAIDHIEGGIEFQDAINPAALHLVISAALHRQGPITKSAALKGYYTIPERQRKRLTFESWLAALEATERARSATTEPVERKERA